MKFTLKLIEIGKNFLLIPKMTAVSQNCRELTRLKLKSIFQTTLSSQKSRWSDLHHIATTWSQVKLFWDAHQDIKLIGPMNLQKRSTRFSMQVLTHSFAWEVNGAMIITSRNTRLSSRSLAKQSILFISQSMTFTSQMSNQRFYLWMNLQIGWDKAGRCIFIAKVGMVELVLSPFNCSLPSMV